MNLNGEQKITVVLADDHPMFREGVRISLEREAGIRIVGEAGDGSKALQVIAEKMPTVAVLDMNMPNMTGLDVARAAKKMELKSEIVFLTMFDDEDTLNEAMDLGVRAYILKDSAATDIVAAVLAVADGRHYISPSLTGKLVARKGKREAFASENSGLKSLTEQERKILLLIAESKTSREIAEELFLGQKTVDNYRYKISEKLKLSGAYSLLKFALENKNLL